MKMVRAMKIMRLIMLMIVLHDWTVNPEKIRRSSSAIFFSLLKISWRKETIEGKDTLYKIRYK